jgi:uncharacterized protein
MTLPLMPKATAVWLVENTTLTFEQIAEFCGMHTLEVQGIADDEVAGGIMGRNPITARQLTREEIERCEKNPTAHLKLSTTTQEYIETKRKQKKKGRYTPVARRQDKPDAISWLLKHGPEVTDTQIVRLIGTTKNTIKSIREKSHWNWGNIQPKDPVLLGLCTQGELDILMDKLKEQHRKKEELEAAAAEKRERS